MSSPVYTINKGVNRSVEFRGLKAQWIWRLAGGLIGLLIFFAILYIAGIHPFICLVLVGLTGTGLFVQVYRLSKRYGQYGLLKKMAARNLPRQIHSGSRNKFIHSGQRTQKSIDYGKELG